MTRFSQCCLLVGMLIVFNGCASFANLGNSARKDNGDPSQRYQVEMANMVGRPQIYEGQLEKNMTVQQALEKSGAIRRYRKMDVSIMRVVEETGQPLKLVVNYNGAKRLVSPEQDYALLPGDRVVVEPAVGLLDRLGGSK